MTMAKLYGVPVNHRVVVEELAEIREKHQEELGHKDQKWYELFTAPRMAYRIAVGVALQALQQLTGANYFFYYGTVIFKSTGITNSYVTQMILGGVNFGTTFLGLYVVEHFGRRRSLIFGAFWMFFWSVLLSHKIFKANFLKLYDIRICWSLLSGPKQSSSNPAFWNSYDSLCMSIYPGICLNLGPYRLDYMC